MKTEGLKFEKFDLHIHTPASDDYKEKATAEEIVNKAIEKGLKGIAITDHQTGKFINEVKKAATGKDLVIFPGVELLVPGGKEGLHIIILFDVDKYSKNVNEFLNKLGIYEDEFGKRKDIPDKTIGEISRELYQYDKKAIIILAHCQSSKGVLGDITGTQRKMIFEAPNVMGVETTKDDFFNEEKRLNHKRVIDLLNGKDPNYNYRKLGVYQASDSHELDSIGQRFTYFKVDEPVTIEDLRQTLIDRDMRIRQDFEYEKVDYPYIKSVRISGGFLEGAEFEFHKGLNSILGAKGSGKSLAIEFLRFALNQQPHHPTIIDDHNEKLENRLEEFGCVEVETVDETNKLFLISREYNPKDDNPITIKDLSDNSERDFRIDQIFPVLFLSQGEIAKIAEDETGREATLFIDKFFDFHLYQNQISELEETLRELDQEFAECLRAHLSSKSIEKRIKTLKEELLKLNRQIRNPIFAEYKKEEEIGKNIRSYIDFVQRLIDEVDSTLNEINTLQVPEIDEGLKDIPLLKQISERTKEALNTLCDDFKGTKGSLLKKQEVILVDYQKWEHKFDKVKENYNKAVKESGGTQISLDQRRSIIFKEIEKLGYQLIIKQKSANQVTVIFERRNKVLTNLLEIYKSYFAIRKERCDFFTNVSNKKLLVSVKQASDTTDFKNNLMRLKKGSWLKDDEIENISSKISSVDFVTNLLRYECTGRIKNEPLDKISEKVHIHIERIKQLSDFLLNEYKYEELLSLQYRSIPRDMPEIKYNIGNDTYRLIKDVSVGQKSTALVIMALSDGKMPIVIDQPEDSLDIRSVWEDVCSKLRKGKDRRQFIFTTHNSSVAVASDTDKFTILEADALQGKVIHSGSLNKSEMKKEVIDYLEGGHNTYKFKRLKYNL